MAKDTWGVGRFDYQEIKRVAQDPSKTEEEEAKYVFTHVSPDIPPDTWSIEAYYWGMEGRGYTHEEAERIISDLGAAGIVGITEDGHVQYPPSSSPDQPAPEVSPEA